jgi:hypothetical protein
VLGKDRIWENVEKFDRYFPRTGIILDDSSSASIIKLTAVSDHHFCGEYSLRGSGRFFIISFMEILHQVHGCSSLAASG